MLTEGWDASNVTHVLGIRAFGSQLLCEQVVGRGLRRRTYEVRDNGLGMDARQLAALFQPFNRLGRERSERPGTILCRKMMSSFHSRDATWKLTTPPIESARSVSS